VISGSCTQRKKRCSFIGALGKKIPGAACLVWVKKLDERQQRYTCFCRFFSAGWVILFISGIRILTAFNVADGKVGKS
jgi:hypothetical protein